MNCRVIVRFSGGANGPIISQISQDAIADEVVNPKARPKALADVPGPSPSQTGGHCDPCDP